MMGCQRWKLTKPHKMKFLTILKIAQKIKIARARMMKMISRKRGKSN